MRSLWTMEAQLKWFLKWNNINSLAKRCSRDILAKMCLLSAYILRTCLRLNLKVLYYFFFLAEEISEQSDIDFVILLLIVTPLEGYNKKRRVGQKRYKIYSLENKRTLKFLMLQSIFVLDERLKLLRIVPLRRGQICIGIKGHVPSGQEYTQLTLQLVREGRRHFLILEGNCNQKLFLIWFTWYMFQSKLGAKYDSFAFFVLLLES